MKQTAASNLKKNDIIVLDITSMSYGGMGVARYCAGQEEKLSSGGMVVFVENAVAGDRAEVRILKNAGSHCFGRIERLIIPSPQREAYSCPYFGRCGCCFAGFSYEEELRYKKGFVEDAFRKFTSITVPVMDVIPSPVRNRYRNKVQYPVGRGPDGEIKLGFYQKRSHRITEIDSCLLQQQVFDPVIPVVKRWMEKYAVSPYDEKSGRGTIRHICGKTAVNPLSTMVIVVANADTLPRHEELYRMLKSEIPSLNSLIPNINKDCGNVILGKKSKVLEGSSFITENLGGLLFNISANSFFQINPYQAEALYNKALTLAEPDGTETVFDFYSGVGTIAQFFARKAKQVIGIEIVPEAVKDASKNAVQNGLSNCRFICGDTAAVSAQLLKEGLCPEIITVDPARRGLDSAAVATMSELGPKKIIYISCDPNTLARDCELFAKRGYKTVEIQPFDMFPGTYHVENVVCLNRSDKPK